MPAAQCPYVGESKEVSCFCDASWADEQQADGGFKTTAMTVDFAKQNCRAISVSGMDDKGWQPCQLCSTLFIFGFLVGGSLNVGFWQKVHVHGGTACATPHLEIWRTGPWFAPWSDVAPTGFLMPVSTLRTDLPTMFGISFHQEAPGCLEVRANGLISALTVSDLC